MSEIPFCHLHFHTEYSMLDGACHIEGVMDRAHDLGMSSVAITDHGVMYGVIDFYKAAKKRGIKPILGCEVYLAPEGMRMHERKASASRSQSNHLILLAENNEGYNNLVKLVSKAHLDGFYYKPRIDKTLLAEHSRGLIGLSACLKGDIAESLVQHDLDGAVGKAEEYTEIFGRDSFFLELQDHGIPEQRLVNEGILELQKRTGLQKVITNDVHYLDPNHHEAHDVMICLQTQTIRSDPNRMRYNSTEFYMKSAQEMRDRFSNHMDAFENTVAIAERCNVDLHLSKNLHFPTYKVPEGFTQKSYLEKLVKHGLKHRYNMEDVDHPQNDHETLIADRFALEFDVIENTGFINYFLVVWDFIHFARDCCIPVGPGRGSGAGSIVAYALGITGIDPLKYNLIFERFLNPERVSPPDFDIDFCQNRRDEVIQYVKDKYGRDNVAQVITFGTMGAKTVIRDIGRVLSIPFAECDRLAKMIPEEPGMTLEKALKESPDFRKATQTEENAQNIMKHARILEGLPRNPGTHAAGVVISEKPLMDLIPLSRDKNQEVITQFEMKSLEEVGLLKMDFLGLKTLTVIQETVDNIKATEGTALDPDTLEMDDEATLALLNRGDTVGVFQVESKGMRDLLRRIGLTQFEDLIAMIALFRPGPLNMLDDYVNRKHGKVKLVYDHPLLEPVLQETYGVMLYQEQVQQAANVLAGFTLAEGDLLRRAMGKKIPSEMEAMKDKFVQGCVKHNNIAIKKAEKIFANIERFAGYGFNKSHSAAYAILSYQTAFLKAHYPVQFMAALLSSEMGNTDKLPILITEAKEMGIDVRPPDVNNSNIRFMPEGDGIRFGMAGIKNVGAGAVEAMVKEREAAGPFEGLLDFCERIDGQLVNRKVLESLIKCGAFDFTNIPRGRVFTGVEFALIRASTAQRDRQSGQGSLFDMLGESSEKPKDDDLPAAQPWPDSEMLSHEKDLLGFYISGHPLTTHAWILDRYALTSIEHLLEEEASGDTRLGGLITQFQKRFTKKDQRAMAVFRLVDMTGSIEVVVFADAFDRYGVFLKEDAPVMVCGSTRVEEQVRIMGKEIYPLTDVPRHFTDAMSIHIPSASINDEHLDRIKGILKKYPGDTQVIICLQFPTGEKVFINTDRSMKVTPEEQLTREIEHILGENSIYLDVKKSPFMKKQTNNGKKFAYRQAS